VSTEASQARDTDVLDLEALEQNVGALRTSFQSATPYPHIVFDDFLEQRAAHEAMEEFAALQDSPWHSYVHVNEAKFSHTDPTSWGPCLRRILDTLNSPRFVDFVGELTGIEGLMADPALEGGGLHRSTTGGFLNVHADFTVHPHHLDWSRRINLLLYLNEDWRPNYGGDLELWSPDMKRCEKSIAPLGNRVVIFRTDMDSFHGHPEPMTCPKDVHRRSMALYYFTREDRPVVRSTEYRGRPGDGLRSALIYADKQLLRTYDRIKRRFGLSDDVAWKVLGRLDRLKRKGSPEERSR
jgi:hypothetical protein